MISKLKLIRVRLGVFAKKYTSVITVLVMITTIALIAYYFVNHSSYLQHLAKLSPRTIAAIGSLYLVILIILTVQYDSLLKLCGICMPGKENLLLTCYSSVINFFGPLQSGPGVRAAYLRNRYKLKIRDYFRVTLWYYGLFAAFSGAFLLSGKLNSVEIIILFSIVAISGILICRSLQHYHSRRSGATLSIKPIIILTIATFLQVLVTSFIYFLELHSVNANIRYSQALSYTGAGNFALFVSLTPGAIGFREAFLIFSRKIHHIATPIILSASIIDRGIYVVFLSLIFLISLAIHARQRFTADKQMSSDK